MLVRRYFQNDLRRSAYVSVIMRYVMVILLAWVLHILFPDDSTIMPQANKNALAFIIGVFPHIGWKVIVSLVKIPIKAIVPSLQQDFPLSDLDGLNIWYESRLLEEGIEDMQNLATANLVDLMLNTRIPVERLVDWVDQSILCMHLGKKKEGESPQREILRAYGIRCATDLDVVFFFDEKELSNKLDFNKISEASLKRIKQDPLIHILDSPDKTVKPTGSILYSVLRALKRAPNLYHIRQWKRYSQDQTQLFVKLKEKEKQLVFKGKEAILLNMQVEINDQLNKMELGAQREALEAAILGPLKNSLKSLRSKEGTSIEFRNNSDSAISICWINHDEEAINYKVLEPQITYTQYTYKGHKWQVRNGKTDEQIFLAIGEDKPTIIEILPDEIMKNGRSVQQNPRPPILPLKKRAKPASPRKK